MRLKLNIDGRLAMRGFNLKRIDNNGTSLNYVCTDNDRIRDESIKETGIDIYRNDDNNMYVQFYARSNNECKVGFTNNYDSHQKYFPLRVSPDVCILAAKKAAEIGGRNCHMENEPETNGIRKENSTADNTCRITLEAVDGVLEYSTIQKVITNICDNFKYKASYYYEDTFGSTFSNDSGYKTIAYSDDIDKLKELCEKKGFKPSTSLFDGGYYINEVKTGKGVKL